MTQQEIQERNKQIAIMMGGVTNDMPILCYPMEKDEINLSFDLFEEKLFSNAGGSGWKIKDLKFHLDWNWLMEAVEFIEKLGKYSFAIDSHPLSGHTVLIHNATSHGITSLVIPDVTMPYKKEAVFIAVSDFAKLYNNKEL
jgi:hypothetical protein